MRGKVGVGKTDTEMVPKLLFRLLRDEEVIILHIENLGNLIREIGRWVCPSIGTFRQHKYLPKTVDSWDLSICGVKDMTES